MQRADDSVQCEVFSLYLRVACAVQWCVVQCSGLGPNRDVSISAKIETPLRGVRQKASNQGIQSTDREREREREKRGRNDKIPHSL